MHGEVNPNMTQTIYIKCKVSMVTLTQQHIKRVAKTLHKNVMSINTEHANQCLADYGRLLIYPLLLEVSAHSCENEFKWPSSVQNDPEEESPHGSSNSNGSISLTGSPD